ncbi:transaldolase family protein [Amnibacterium flavum]|uniref:Transaldolase n=1 Tax=Amnibacterium flavum TaxID=2173173 RepID=A0A2V1HU88_9MICO|nr:transaldolase family protein [Amnibacterium flavum]PVZ95252.1 hypothetical protein DDQ50_01635 [Amnibacterium flavum]
MLYLDSADRTALTPLLETGIFSGVTTNPLILHRAGLTATDLPALADWVAGFDGARFFAQATGRTIADVRASADRVAALGDRVVIKLVCNTAGLTVAKELTDAGREVLITAVYHPTQMLLASAVSAQFIAPYVRRSGEAGRDGTALVRGLRELGSETGPRILAASLSTVEMLQSAMEAGSHDATISPALASSLLDDELTGAAAEEFEAVAR